LIVYECYTKKILIILIVCIGLRSLFVVIAKNISVNVFPYLGYLALIPVIGFIYIFATDSRKTGAEVFGEKNWWNNLRPLHAVLYGLFAFNAIKGNKDAWIYLLIDVLIGVFSFSIFHYVNGDFSKLVVSS
jgi:hypothetical protein